MGHRSNAQDSARLGQSGPGSTPRYFRAVAVDFDGTLAEDDIPNPDALSALQSVRSSGVRTILVTGRTLTDLRRVFPDVEEYFDLVVAENGAVLSRGGADWPIAQPIPPEVDAALDAKGIYFQRGEVLVACHAAEESSIWEQVRGLGLECQLVRNRGALMILPAGVSKGSGLFEGLGELGISHHNTIAIGDAENDHSLLDMSELGAAVSNAVGPLKAHADIVLDERDGKGLAALLQGPIMAGYERLHPKRWQIELGYLPDGSPVTIPASQLNILITGSPRRGKSYVAGLVAERLINHHYSVLILDPEGDHTNLSRLRGVLAVGGDTRLPSPEEIVKLVNYRLGSVVVDLSAVAQGERSQYLRNAPAAIEQQRSHTGLPHWVVIDEAQEPLGRDGPGRAFFEAGTSGYCMATYRPDDLCPEALDSIDVLIALPGGADSEPSVRLMSGVGAMSQAAAEQLLSSAGPGEAVLVNRSRPGGGIVFAIGPRGTSHLRHWHKYATGGLARERRFYFRSSWETATGATAGSIEDFERELRTCSDEVIRHHCKHLDFSRWIIEVLGDPPLSNEVAAIEAELGSGAKDPVATRAALIAAVGGRYPR